MENRNRIMFFKLFYHQGRKIFRQTSLVLMVPFFYISPIAKSDTEKRFIKSYETRKTWAYVYHDADRCTSHLDRKISTHLFLIFCIKSTFSTYSKDKTNSGFLEKIITFSRTRHTVFNITGLKDRPNLRTSFLESKPFKNFHKDFTSQTLDRWADYCLPKLKLNRKFEYLMAKELEDFDLRTFIFTNGFIGFYKNDLIPYGSPFTASSNDTHIHGCFVDTQFKTHLVKDALIFQEISPTLAFWITKDGKFFENGKFIGTWAEIPQLRKKVGGHMLINNFVISKYKGEYFLTFFTGEYYEPKNPVKLHIAKLLPGGKISYKWHPFQNDDFEDLEVFSIGKYIVLTTSWNEKLQKSCPNAYKVCYTGVIVVDISNPGRFRMAPIYNFSVGLTNVDSILDMDGQLFLNSGGLENFLIIFKDHFVKDNIKWSGWNTPVKPAPRPHRPPKRGK